MKIAEQNKSVQSSIVREGAVRWVLSDYGGNDLWKRRVLSLSNISTPALEFEASDFYRRIGSMLAGCPSWTTSVLTGIHCAMTV